MQLLIMQLIRIVIYAASHYSTYKCCNLRSFSLNIVSHAASHYADYEDCNLCSFSLCIFLPPLTYTSLCDIEIVLSAFCS